MPDTCISERSAPEPEAPRVSVVVPVYNAARTLEAAITSVRAQTFRDWEVIIVDDGSTDESLEVAMELRFVDPRVQVVFQPNRGVASARNTGLEVARGAFVAFLDADDTWHPGKLKMHLAFFEARPDVDLSYAQIRFMNTDGTLTAVTSNRAITGLTPTILLAENIACTMSNVIVRRSVVQQVGYFNYALKFDEDKEWLFRAFAAGCVFEGVDTVLTNYRTSPGGLASDAGQMERDWLAFVEAVRHHAPKQVNRVFSEARAIFLRNLARRMLRLRVGGASSLHLYLRALSSSPLAVRHEPRRWALTGVLALLVAALPATLSRWFLQSLDSVPSKLTDIARLGKEGLYEKAR